MSNKKPQWLIDAEKDIQEFANSKYGKFTKTQMRQSYANSSRIDTNSELRITNMTEGIRNSEAHTQARLKNVSKTWQSKSRTEAVTKTCKEEVTCPHCNKVGARSGMKSWHFDHCKQNPNRVPRTSKHKKRQ